MAKKMSNKKLLVILTAIVFGMFGFAFALIPIYNSLCKSLGINGKTNPNAIAYEATANTVDKSRELIVEFVATNNSGLPWKFYPKTHRIKVHPGEVAKLAFYAENRTDHTMTVQAIPSVTPGLAAKYLKKTECFCFTQQTLNAHEAMNMPLLFHVDKEVPKNIRTITLAYTLFDVTDRAKDN